MLSMGNLLTLLLMQILFIFTGLTRKTRLVVCVG
jgi:hypothetical protein